MRKPFEFTEELTLEKLKEDTKMMPHDWGKLKATKEELEELAASLDKRELAILCYDCESQLAMYVPDGKTNHRIGTYKSYCVDTMQCLKNKYLKSKTLGDLKTEHESKYWKILDTVYYMRKKLNMQV